MDLYRCVCCTVCLQIIVIKGIWIMRQQTLTSTLNWGSKTTTTLVGITEVLQKSLKMQSNMRKDCRWNSVLMYTKQSPCGNSSASTAHEVVDSKVHCFAKNRFLSYCGFMCKTISSTNSTNNSNNNNKNWVTVKISSIERKQNRLYCYVNPHMPRISMSWIPVPIHSLQNSFVQPGETHADDWGMERLQDEGWLKINWIFLLEKRLLRWNWLKFRPKMKFDV